MVVDKLICAICHGETHDDFSEVFDVFYGDGMTQERHCFDCDPADEECAYWLATSSVGKWCMKIQKTNLMRSHRRTHTSANSHKTRQSVRTI